MADAGLYMYAIARGLEDRDLAGTTGLNGRPLRVVEHDDLVAVVSEVSLDEFGEEGLRRNLEDLRWLEEVARGHDAVVQQVAAHGATAPMRLATICAGEQGVRSRLESMHSRLVRALDRIEGRHEWSVKAYADPVAADPGGAGSGAARGAGAGAAYLRRKREETDRRLSAQQDATQAADRVHARLADLAVANRRLPPQDPRLTGHTGTMVLNGAYLVDDADAAEFAEQVAALDGQEAPLRLEVNGPWPPYSFATLDDS